MAETIRCSQWARHERLDPVGSAPSVQGYLLVWWPLPWPADAAQVPALGEVVGQAKAQGVRVQLVAGDATEPIAVLYRKQPAGLGFTGFRSTEMRAADPTGVVQAALELLDRPDVASSPGARKATGVGSGDGPAQGVTDVLVCTHGRRDRCCGALGMALYSALAGDGDSALRIWRTSHTGGHRFAPTAVVLPEGTAWAFVDEALVRQVVDRTGSFADVAERYRGCSGFSDAAGQVLERIALRDVGWSVLDAGRHAEEIGHHRHRLTVTWPGGRVETWEATIDVGRRLTLPACGSPEDGSLGGGSIEDGSPSSSPPPKPSKTEPEYVARHVVRSSSGDTGPAGFGVEDFGSEGSNADAAG